MRQGHRSMRGAASTAAINNPDTRAKRPKLLDEVRRRLRLKHYSLCVEQTYTYWIRQQRGRVHFSGNSKKRTSENEPDPYSVRCGAPVVVVTETSV